jgi:hypothetical protein
VKRELRLKVTRALNRFVTGIKKTGTVGGGTRLRIPILAPISGTPIRSGIPIPFLILKIPV